MRNVNSRVTVRGSRNLPRFPPLLPNRDPVGSRKIQVTYLPSTTSADYASNISTFIGKKCGIIVTVGFLMADATEAAAKANPKQKFAIVDCSYASECLTGAKEKNIDQLVFDTVQDGFLGGYLAAGMSKSGIVATYGGEDFGTVTIYEDGFWDGVQYYNTHHQRCESPPDDGRAAGGQPA
jgi:basic membrane protein A and related proteins